MLLGAIFLPIILAIQRYINEGLKMNSHIFSDFNTKCQDINEPIDFVLTWVNGSDLEFVKSISQYRNETENVFEDSRQSNNRYADFDQMKYALRSIERFAPWVNHIYIVTNGQVYNGLRNFRSIFSTVCFDLFFSPSKSSCSNTSLM